MKKKKVLIFIVAYNANRFIETVLERIPESVWENPNYDVEVLVVDDSSNDNTAVKSNIYALESCRNIRTLHNPVNQGYGGNQKIGYTYAIKYKFDVVVLLHGDGQYAPEKLDELITPIINKKADMVIGSRMINKRDALKGGMPLYKFIGNIILTKIQNSILNTSLSEFHSGYRAYNVAALKKIPFEYNSNDFDFDTDILIQLISCNYKIHEVPIPTYYGDEISHVNGIKYAWNIVKSTLQSRVQKLEIYYHEKFDYQLTQPTYTSKTDFDSSHTYAIDAVEPESVVLDIGCGSGVIAKELNEKKCIVHGFDQYIDTDAAKHCASMQIINLDKSEFNLEHIEDDIDYILLLDVIEHLDKPEKFINTLREKMSYANPKIIITTGNVAFIVVRLSLLLGQFNYGKRGILDLTHSRLFTFDTLQRMLKSHGYTIKQVQGLPLPTPLILGENWLSLLLLKINKLLIKVSKGLFSYQIAIIAEPSPTVDVLLENAIESGREYKEKAMKKHRKKKTAKSA